MKAALYGVGVDILHVERMEKLWRRHGERLLEKILSADERAELATRGGKAPAQYLAKAFAAKEAFVKALGTGFRDVGYADVGVVRDRVGKPALALSARLRKRLARLGAGAAHVSLSDEGGLVCAMVVLERVTRPRPR